MSPTIVEGHSFARAGLLGNPSDGYFGRTLSVILRDFRATVTLEESSELRIEPGSDDLDQYRSVDHLVDTVSRQGYYGGARLLKAALKTFFDYCREGGLTLPKRNFAARYESSIPRQVGLGGSSAIVASTLRALMSFYEVVIPVEQQPTLVLSAELVELGITAGLQDRVVQIYEGLVYMDFSRKFMEDFGHGLYEPLDPGLLPRMFVAHLTGPAKVSGRVLEDIRMRWENGDEEVHGTLSRIGDLAKEGKGALLEGNHRLFSSLMNENFDLRRAIMRIGERDLAMVKSARSLGASAKLTGSGGAIIGVVADDAMFEELSHRLGDLGARVIEPVSP
ncbi:mevalonate kinase [Gemmatimonadota bacterium]